MGSGAGPLARGFVAGRLPARRPSVESDGCGAGRDERTRGGRSRADRSGIDGALRLSGRRTARQAALRAAGDTICAARAGGPRMPADAGYTRRYLRLFLAFPGRLLSRLRRARPDAVEGI